MVPNSQAYSFQSSTAAAGGPFPFQASFSDMAFPGQMYPSQSLSDQNMDPNSPELFKVNIRLVQEQLNHVRNIARESLDGMYVLVSVLLWPPICLTFYPLAKELIFPRQVPPRQQVRTFISPPYQCYIQKPRYSPHRESQASHFHPK